ncbi:MAG TPA: lipoate--protein ligase [Mogibacterium sp.]|nr:lipoate--protein ligase [Mogibacterium sp.]
MGKENIKLKVIRTDITDPYINMAVEESLTFKAKEGEVILFLWQNDRTVVIGRNQNPGRECNVERIEKDNIYLARRTSGGGAVYQDLGNLNFTFIAKDALYDIRKQTQVVLLACKLLKIKAERSGINDLTVEGKKFSGQAYYSSNGYNYHNGMIMMDVNLEDMSKYLQEFKPKLKIEGIESVKPRMVNLKEYLPKMKKEKMISWMQDSLIRAFGREYGVEVEEIQEVYFPIAPKMLIEKYSSKKWLFGTQIYFEKEICHRFEWGEVQVQISMEGENISSCRVFSDALETEMFVVIEDLLTGTKYDAALIRRIKIPSNISAVAYEILHWIANSI